MDCNDIRARTTIVQGRPRVRQLCRQTVARPISLRLRQGRIRDLTFVLIEFPRREQALGRDHQFAELADDGGLADTTVARHQNEFNLSLPRNSIKRRSKRAYFRPPSIELFWDQQPVGDIARADSKGLNLPVGLPCCQIGRAHV